MDKFDELTKQMAQSVTRRAAFKRFGVGLAGMGLACFGLANKAEATNPCLPSGTVCVPGGVLGGGNGQKCSKCCNGYASRFSWNGFIWYCK